MHDTIRRGKQKQWGQKKLRDQSRAGRGGSKREWKGGVREKKRRKKPGEKQGITHNTTQHNEVSKSLSRFNY